MDWQPVRSLSRLLLSDSWDRLQLPHTPEEDKAGTENGWMDGCLAHL